MISHGVEISIAGGVGEMVRAYLLFVFLFYFILFYFYFILFYSIRYYV